MAYITIEGFKAGLLEMKNYIVAKFYNKTETDNLLNGIKSDVELVVGDTLDAAINTTIPTQVTSLVNTKLSEYDTVIEGKIETHLTEAGILTTTDLDITKVITTDNLAINNIAKTSDLPTAVSSTDFANMINDLTTSGGVY